MSDFKVSVYWWDGFIAWLKGLSWLANGSIPASKLASAMNTNGYLSIPFSFKDLAAAGNQTLKMKSPVAGTIVGAQGFCSAASGTAATIDFKNGATDILSAPIDVKTGAGTPALGTVAHAAVAQGDTISAILTQTGAGATADGYGYLILKVPTVSS